MPPKRRSGRTSKDGASAAKKSKTACEVDGVSVRWEWENDGGVWDEFSEAHAEDITSACDADKNNVILETGAGVKLEIKFDRMVQKNKRTGWERRLRCSILCKAGSGDYYVWQWEDENGRWNPYPAKTCIALEKAREGGDSTYDFTAMGRQYSVDVAKLEQKNIATAVVRKVERAKSDGEVAIKKEVDEEEEVKPSTSKSTRKSAPAKSRGGRAAVKEEVDEEEEVKPSTSQSTKSKSGAKSNGTKSGRGGVKEEPKEVIKTIVKKGAAPVDPECKSKVGVAHVFTEGKDIYDTMLNQTNLQNNNNKYYLIQLLEDDAKKAYSVWQRWGRVGKVGQSNLVPCGPDLDEAKRVFCKKFSDKTKNEWSDRNKFKKVGGKYDMVSLDYGGKESLDEVDTPDTSSVEVPDSKLKKSLQTLINLICDVKSMEDAVVEMKYDAKKAPLGKLTSQQIKAGYAALKKIETCIVNNDLGARLIQANDEFYTRIPHDFGMRRPEVIRTKSELKEKMSLLEALDDIEVAMKIIKQRSSTENPIDTHYHSLKCGLEPLSKTDADFKMIEDYVQNTHAITHNQYKMQVLDVFAMDKEGEARNYNDVGNRLLLWHGSRLTNWVGILSKGLRIAPPEAPVTGYMFGKGVYFADMSSKSANYCFASKSKNVGLLLLCEVALGNCNELLAADYTADKLPPGKHSVFGKGRIAPDPSKTFKMSDGTAVPLGKGKDTGVSNPHGYTLNYNEFIVYNTNQIKMKYLVKTQFNFK